jgi:SnoaL-like domain
MSDLDTLQLSDFVTLRTRVTHLEDLEELRDLKALYAQRTDDNHHAPTHATAVAAAALFAEDGILDIGPGAHYVGRPAILDAYENIFPTQTTWSSHYVTQPLISLSGATATGVWRFLLYTQPRATPPGPVLVLNGRYEEKYVKTSAGWRFKEVYGIITTP